MHRITAHCLLGCPVVAPTLTISFSLSTINTLLNLSRLIITSRLMAHEFGEWHEPTTLTRLPAAAAL